MQLTRTTATARKNDEGMALILSLLFIVLLTALVVEFSYETQVETSVVAANLNDFQALVGAKSAVSCGMSLLAADLLNLNTNLNAAGMGRETEPRETGGEEDGEDAMGTARYDGLDEAWALGVPYQQMNNAVMQCAIADECGKLNLNALFSRRRQQPNTTLIETLRYLLEARGAEEGTVDAIVDWVDQDDEIQANGAESDYYQGLGIPYTCKNGPMSSVEELLMVRGITPEIFFGDAAQEQLPLTELLTVYGQRNGRININTAPYEVLQALGETLGVPGLGELAIQERQIAPFLNNRDATDRGLLPPQEERPRREEDAPPAPRPFAYSSSVFRIRGTGFAGDTRVRIEAFFSRDMDSGPEGFRMLEWREIR